MRRKTGVLAINIMFLLLGVANLIGYSEKVRFHDLVRISASGTQIGAALVGIVLCCLAFSGKLRLADKKPAEEQSSLPDARTR